MRVLWFSVTPSLYKPNDTGHNGGGWIEALERIVSTLPEIDLGIAFVSDVSDPFKVRRASTTYYPIYLGRSLFDRVIKDHLTYADIDKVTISKCLDVIDDFKPDIIQVFGSEWCFGLLKEHTDIPIVIHMQGSWPAYRNATLYPAYNKTGEYLRRLYNPYALLSFKARDMKSLQRSRREEHILRINTHYMGRTRWDKALVQLYAPNAHYYYCGEALRADFVKDATKWQPTAREKKILITVGSSSRLKGLECVLKVAKLIVENSTLPFEWHLLGPDAASMAVYERRVGCRCDEVNILPLGRCAADEVKAHLLGADIFIHTAYIDNSPNALCEAQYLGLPIISTNVGGTHSLFADDYRQDMLVPANDPYYLASKILELLSSPEVMQEMSASNYEIARVRHSDEQIAKHLLSAYTDMLNGN